MKTLIIVLISIYIVFMWTAAAIVKCIGLDNMSWFDVLSTPITFWL